MAPIVNIRDRKKWSETEVIAVIAKGGTNLAELARQSGWTRTPLRKLHRVHAPPEDQIKLSRRVRNLVAPVEFVPLPSPKQPRHVTPWILRFGAFMLAGAGMTMNAWYASSLGSNEIARWAFTGIAATVGLMALITPSWAARLWHMRRWFACLVAWLIFGISAVFDFNAGLGFASTNIADTTMARASRSTPAIVAAQAALSDVRLMMAQECRSGVGPVCRRLENDVFARQAALDSAMRSVEQSADPQTDAVIKVVSWWSMGSLKPTGNDFGVIKLTLLALLSQIGGLLLMIARERK